MKVIVACMMLLTVAMLALAQGEHVPAYNLTAPKASDLMPILPADQRVGENFKFPFQVKSYELAGKIPVVIAQMPCYCYCERMGHGSLHTCFESNHGAHCGICMKEVFYAYQQTQMKKTPAQIRDGIIKGEWKMVDLEAAGSAK